MGVGLRAVSDFLTKPIRSLSCYGFAAVFNLFFDYPNSNSCVFTCSQTNTRSRRTSEPTNKQTNKQTNTMDRNTEHEQPT